MADVGLDQDGFEEQAAVRVFREEERLGEAARILEPTFVRLYGVLHACAQRTMSVSGSVQVLNVRCLPKTIIINSSV